MNKLDAIKREIRKDWYIQGFSAFPVFLNSAAHSGFVMKKELGFGYTEFLFNYKNGYGEMWYLASDFPQIWKIIKSRLKGSPDYLQQVKRKYEEIYNRNKEIFSKIDNSKLRNIGEKELIDLLKKCSLAATDGAGIGHILDPIGPEGEKELKAKLAKYIPDGKERNQAFISLTVPEELSFIAREEKELEKIARDRGAGYKKNIEKHIKKYFWIQNSFAGAKKLGLDFFEKRAEALRKTPLHGIAAEENKNLKKKYKFDRETNKLIEIIKFSAIWQDQRKANAMRSVGYLAKTISEISRRTGMRESLLNYLGFSDVLEVKSLKGIKGLRKELSQRGKGLFFWMKLNKEQVYFGKEYKDLSRYREKLSATSKEESKELHGSIASQGTAVGNAVICLGTRSLDKVKKGDVIVASMTRPEYMPALRKAAAIITDEGGITSHAAIIARELKIPAVIGTKIATKILKDGDLVEVRANHGVVKIIRKSA